jgi:dihydroorotate dehydrogenase electron transfer subunit
MGIVSLYPLVEAFGEGQCSVFIGGKTQHDILCVDDFEKCNANIFIATEDGSMGHEGTVIDLFLSRRKGFRTNKKYYLYACGPARMLRALAEAIRGKNFIGQASLEARMGCGFGACWGCVVKTKYPKTPYQRVCKDGPVFRLEDIVWE